MSGAIPPHTQYAFMAKTGTILFFKYRCIKMSPMLREFGSGKIMCQIKIVRDYNIACCFVWVSNLVDHIEGGT